MNKGRYEMIVVFTTRDGDTLTGNLVRVYSAAEGGMRYIISVDGKEYRCVRNNAGEYIEYVI